MVRDPVVLGENYILPGDDVGRERPNTNVMIVGTTGCGKSTSTVLPTAAQLERSNPVLPYAKEADAYRMALYLDRKGYRCRILNIARPERSTISLDPVSSLASYEDIDSLSSAIVDSTIEKATDDYWNAKAKRLLSSLIAAVIMAGEDDSCGMADVLRLFDHVLPKENGSGVSSAADGLFRELQSASPGCYAVREYNAWKSLPYKTASCCRDTLSASLSAVFPEAIRAMMRKKS